MKAEGARNTSTRDRTIHDAKMVALMGGGHHSVTEHRHSRCYCEIMQPQREYGDWCADCPFRTE